VELRAAASPGGTTYHRVRPKLRRGSWRSLDGCVALGGPSACLERHTPFGKVCGRVSISRELGKRSGDKLGNWFEAHESVESSDSALRGRGASDCAVENGGKG
jgi:hypothetical protein